MNENFTAHPLTSLILYSKLQDFQIIIECPNHLLPPPPPLQT